MTKPAPESSALQGGRSSLDNFLESLGNLPDQPYISLIQAISWIAFGNVATDEGLVEFLKSHRPSDDVSNEQRLKDFFASPSHAEDAPISDEIAALIDQLTAAWIELLESVENEQLALRGRYTSSFNFDDASLGAPEPLGPEKLAAFSQIDLLTGGLRRRTAGMPIILHPDAPVSFDREILAADGQDDRLADGFLMVEVHRQNLLRSFAHRNSHFRPSTRSHSNGKTELHQRNRLSKANFQAAGEPASAQIIKAPRLADAKLESWWSCLPEEKKLKPQTALLEMCRQAHPRNSISRARIRALTEGRKPGPRPIRRKATAQFPPK